MYPLTGLVSKRVPIITIIYLAWIDIFFIIIIDLKGLEPITLDVQFIYLRGSCHFVHPLA